MEALHAVLQALQVPTFDLASHIAIRASCLVSARVTGGGRRPIDCYRLYRIGKDGEDVLIL